MSDRLAAYKAVASKLFVNPDDPRAIVERQYFITGSGKAREINVALARRASDLAPNRFEVAFNLGSALLNCRDPWGAIETFKRALELSPESHRAATVHHIGLAYHDMGLAEEALASYREAKAIDPKEPEIDRSIAIAKLSNGQLAEGLFEFEIEHYQPWRKPIFQSGIPRWRGEVLTDKTIIVAHEQGFGDSIQFCRFIPQIKAKRVLWSGPDALTGLITDHIKVDGTVSEAGPFEADYYASPMSACAVLGIGYDRIEGKPYLSAEPMKLGPRGKLKVGLVWRGSSGYARDYDRSLRIDDYAPLFGIPGAAFYSLQVGEFADDVNHFGLTGFVADLTPLLKDWRDTARAIAAMDVVVSVDTATAHLAGAMGKPTFIVLPYSPCWRWLRDSDTSPWYDSVRLFRQHDARSWAYPIGEVERQLRAML